VLIPKGYFVLYYRDLGYTEDWIAKRMQSIEIRGQLTDEWKDRDVQEGLEYAILTAEISRATFGKTPSQYKKQKVARKGGKATGEALKTYEEQTGQKVVTNKNFLHQVSEAKKAQKLKNKEEKEQKKLEDKKKKDKK